MAQDFSIVDGPNQLQLIFSHHTEQFGRDAISLALRTEAGEASVCTVKITDLTRIGRGVAEWAFWGETGLGLTVQGTVDVHLRQGRATIYEKGELLKVLAASNKKSTYVVTEPNARFKLPGLDFIVWNLKLELMEDDDQQPLFVVGLSRRDLDRELLLYEKGEVAVLFHNSVRTRKSPATKEAIKRIRPMEILNIFEKHLRNDTLIFKTDLEHNGRKGRTITEHLIKTITPRVEVVLGQY